MQFVIKHTVTCVLLILSCICYSQTYFNLNPTRSSKVHFKLIDNLIIIPVEINGVELSFVLDTGVSRPILFNLTNMDSLQIKNTDKIHLKGLGGTANIEAIRSKGNIISIAEAVGVNRDIYVVFDPSINFTPRLGIPIHGIIGYDVFRDFVVEVNYQAKFMRLHKHNTFTPKRSKKWQRIPITLYNRKPYLNASIHDTVPVKLLIDSGGSDSVWLFEDQSKGITIPKDMYFDDFLGQGLSGSVYGKRSKLEQFSIGNFTLQHINVAYPDSSSLNTARHYKPRNGSVAGHILKRFNMFFDYANRNLYLKKNANFNLPFYYNNSGITVEQRGLRLHQKRVQPASYDGYREKIDWGKTISLVPEYKFELLPAFYIVELRESSNAKLAGLQTGDLILSINSKNASDLTLQQINNYFYDRKGKLIRLGIERYGRTMSFVFRLDDVFAKKEELQYIETPALSLN